MSRSAIDRRIEFALLAAACIGCSSSAPGQISYFGDSPAQAQAEPPFDPRAPGASIICDRGSVDPHPFVFVVSALNHKLAQYPDFAASAGLDTVSECDGANRFMEAYREYEREHPSFDADEPLGDSPEVEPPPPPIEPAEDPEISKIAGVSGPSVNYPVVQITYQTCKPVNGQPSCPQADASWIVRGNDYRNWHESCSATFISKNWLLTAAHCLIFPAIDQCMHNGVTRANCKPNWDLYASWRIQGAFRTGDLGVDGIMSADDLRDNFDRNISARGYIMKENWAGAGTESWAGTDIGKVQTTCDTPGCFDAFLIAEHDLALIYIPPEYNDRLPPRPEDDGAKRLSIVNPPDVAHWQLAVAGWGLPGSADPGARFLRQGTNLGTTAAPSGTNRIEFRTTGAAFVCPGDSGGPVLRTGLNIQTNTGARSNLDAIIAVNSASDQGCNPVPPVGTAAFWIATRVDNDLHKLFISKTMKRWPNYKNFDCVQRPLGTPPPAISDNEVAECWGKPCTGPGGPQDGGCADTEFCMSPGRTVAQRSPACVVCANFANPPDSGCDCLQGQCMPL